MRSRSLTRELERLGPFDPDAVSEKEAKAVWAAYVKEAGYATVPTFTQPGATNVKVGKGTVATLLLTLAPGDLSGWELCTWRTPECTAACVLLTGGKGPLASVRRARILRTRFLAEHPQEAITLIASEIRRAVRRFGHVVVRLNTASDLRWERIAPALFRIPGAKFYDYTKAPVAHRSTPDGYRLTYSVSERIGSVRNARLAMVTGATSAVVFDTPKGRALPATWLGFPVIDGDVNDNRTLDPTGVVVGLRAKGSARGVAGSAEGFVKVGADS